MKKRRLTEAEQIIADRCAAHGTGYFSYRPKIAPVRVIDPAEYRRSK